MLYPFKFEQLYIKKLWGGNKIKEYFKLPLNLDSVGEAWLLSGVENSETVISTGEFKGKTLNDFFHKKDKLFYDIFGKVCEKYDRFPLLYKFIDSNDKLSIQVHPNDFQAKRLENESFGKNEMWYIINAENDSTIYRGFNKEITKDEFIEYLNNDTILDILNKENVKKDDSILIKAGLIHALNEGILLYEIQQSSDITYRLYDYNRKDKNGKQRPLHINKAIETIDYTANSNVKKSNELLIMNIGKNRIKILGYCQYFALNLFTFNEPQVLSSLGKFYVHTCIQGRIGILYNDKQETILKTGETVFIPASLGEYKMFPLDNKPAKTLFSYIPDIEKDIEKPLIKIGYSISQIIKNKF